MFVLATYFPSFLFFVPYSALKESAESQTSQRTGRLLTTFSKRFIYYRKTTKRPEYCRFPPRTTRK